MAHVNYTGNASQLFGVISQIQERLNQLQKMRTELQMKARLEKGSMTSLRTDVKRSADIISRSVQISIQMRVSNQAEVVRKLKASFAAGIAVKLQPYVTNAAIKTVKDRIKNAVGASTAEVGLRFQQGAAGKFRETLKRMLAVLSRGSYVDAEIRLKNAQKQLSSLQSKKILLDVEVATGTAAKVKALLELLKSLRTGAKIPVKLDMDAGTRLVLQQLVTQLKTAADQAARLGGRLGTASSGAASLASGGRDVTNWWTRASQAFAGLAGSYLVLSSIRRVFSALKDALIDFPTQIQAVQVGFERMLGSKERAEGMMRALKEFAVPTPFETQDLAPLATQALAFKLVDKKDLDAPKQIVSLIKDIGDASFGLGKGQQGVNQLMAAFGQIKVGTRVSGREMLRFQRVGVNAFEYLSQATGKSTKEVRALISKGLLPADKAIAAIRAGLRRDFAGGMEKAAQTMQGATSQIADALRIRLADKFAPQFEQATKAVVRLAEAISSEDFGKKLDSIADVAQGAIGRIGEAWRILTDLYTHNSGLINTALLSVGASLLLLNAYARGGPIGAFLSLASAMQVLSQRTDGVGTAAKALQPVLYGLAAAYVAVKVAAAQAAVAQGVAAASSGSAAGLTGIAAGAARLATVFNTLKGLAGSFKILSGMMGGGFLGGLKALGPLLTSLTAGVSGLALTALPVLVAVLGVAAIGWEKYQEKAARVDAANADLSYSVGRVKEAFESLDQVGSVVPGAQGEVQKLKEQYDKLGDSLDRLQQFKGHDLLLARAHITFDTKLKPLEKQVLLDELNRIQGELDGQIQAAKFKVEVEAEANPLALSNLSEAFGQTFRQILDQLGWFFGQFGYAASVTWEGLKKGWTDLVFGWNKGWGDLWDGMFGTGDTMAGRLFDSLKSAWDRAMSYMGGQDNVLRRLLTGQGAEIADWATNKNNVGIPDASLPSSMTPAQLAEQKRKNAAWRAAHPTGGQVFGPGSGGLSAANDPYGDPANKNDKRTFAQRVAANPGAFTPEERRRALAPDRGTSDAPIPHFDPDPDNKKKGKTEAEKAADREAKARLKAEKDALADNIKALEANAKAVQDWAKDRIEALKSMRDQFRDVFGSMQDEFIRLGIINDPLGPMIRSFERLIDLSGKSEKIVSAARAKFNAYTNNANDARSQQEKLNGLDGVVNSSGGVGQLVGGGSIGNAIARNALNMQKRWGDRIGKVFYQSCDRLADITVNGATKAFASIMGPRKGDTAARTMARFKAAGIGFRPNGQYAPGDIVYSAATRKNGAGHVQVIGPDGRFMDQYGAHMKPTTRPAWVVRAGGSTKGGPASFGTGSGTLDVGSESKFDVSSISGTLSKIVAVPLAWGKAVKSSATTTARFALQTKLATKEFQDQIEAAAVQSGKSVPEIIAWLRQLANAADTGINRINSVDAVTESLRDLAKQKRELERDGNPLSSVMGEFEPGGKFEFAQDKRKSVYDAQMAVSVAQVAKATKEVTRAESMRIGVLKEAAPYLSAQNAGTDAYERALERANIKFEVWNDSQIQGLLKAAASYEQFGGQVRKMADEVEAQIKRLMDNPFVAAPGALGFLLGRENALRDKAHGAFAKGAGLKKTASQNAQTQITAKMSGAEYARAVGRTQENIDTNFELDNRISLLRDETRLLGDSSKSEQEKSDATERANAVLDEQIKLMRAGHSAQRALELANERADKRDIATGITRRNDALRDYNKSQKEVTDGVAAFGDMTGLAALKIELASDKYKKLTDAEKAQMLVNAAATQGLQKYGQEFDSLFSQRFSLAEENMTRQIALTRGLSAVEQQELRWKYADAEIRERLAGMSQAERDAYDQQLPKILAARDAIRGLLAVQQRLAAADWFKNLQRSFRVLAEPNELRRARAELEENLKQQGFDEVVIKVMLDVNDVYLRLERTQDHIRDYIQGISDVFGHAFDEAYEKGPGHFITATLDGFADMIQGVARQLLTAQLTKLFVKAFPSLAGDYDQARTKAEDMNSATLQTAGVSSLAAAAVAELTRRIQEYSAAASQVPSIAGGLGGGGLFGGLLNLATGFFGGGSKSVSVPTGPISAGLAAGGHGLFRGAAAIGVRRVPFDGAIYRTHAGESILTRRETEMYNAISANVGAGGRTTGAMQGGDTNVNIGNITLPQVRDARGFVPALQKEVKPRISRRAEQNLAYDKVNAGKYQR